MKKFNRITAGILAVAMCFTSQAVLAEHFNNPTTATAVTTTKYPSVSLPDNAVKKIDTEVKTVRSNTDTEEADKVIVATSIDELPAEIAEKNYYTADYFKENVVVCYDMTYYYYYLLHTPTNVFVNTDDKIEIQLTDFIDMSNPRTTALTPPSRWYLVAGMSREDYGNREVTKSMQTMVLNEETTTTPVTTVDTEDTTMTSATTSPGTVKFSNAVILNNSFGDYETGNIYTYKNSSELDTELSRYFKDTDFSKKDVVVVAYVGRYFAENLTDVVYNEGTNSVTLKTDCDWGDETTLPEIAVAKIAVFEVDKNSVIENCSEAEVVIKDIVGTDVTTVPTIDTTVPVTDDTTSVSTGKNADEETKIPFTKSVIVSDYTGLDIYYRGETDVYSYQTADELPKEIADYFKDIDFTKQEVIAVPYVGAYPEESLKSVSLMQDGKLKLNLERYWAEGQTVQTIMVKRTAVFAVDRKYSIGETCKRGNTVIKDIHETTLPTTTTPKDTTTTTSDKDIKSVPFNKYVVLPSNYDNNEQYRKNRSYQSAEELPDDLKDFFADTDFSKEEVIVVPYVGLYFEETLAGVRASDKAMYVDLESDWEGNSTIPAIAAFRKVAFSVDKKYNLSTFESANIHIESVNKGQTTVETTDTTTETTTSTDTEESYEIEFGKSAVIKDFICQDTFDGIYKIYAYHTAEELPEELTEMFGDTDFDKEKVIAVQIGGKYFDEVLKAVSVQGKTLKLELECDWGDNDSIPELYVRKLAVFTIPNDNNIKNQMVEECEKISVNSKDIIHTTTSVTDTTDTPDSTTTTVTSTPSITEEADLNGDGKVDVRDLMAAAQFIVGAIDKKYSFDVNGDGKSNILDLMIIAKAIVE